MPTPPGYGSITASALRGHTQVPKRARPSPSRPLRQSRPTLAASAIASASSLSVTRSASPANPAACWSHLLHVSSPLWSAGGQGEGHLLDRQQRGDAGGQPLAAFHDRLDPADGRCRGAGGRELADVAELASVGQFDIRAELDG